ncbi:hypothetical protein [Comamonas sp. BIGb0152]|uniref:hypothetical protein n=1 Tax=Comamonas sp. BIGb0152 TaxID=2940601 RepID=UPI0021677A75|nr:hypothetical protein [Comamonas sp. BIGb0152]
MLRARFLLRFAAHQAEPVRVACQHLHGGGAVAFPDGIGLAMHSLKGARLRPPFLPRSTPDHHV